MDTAIIELPTSQPVSVWRDRLDLRIDPLIRSRIERQVSRFGLDLSAYIRLAIVQRLESDERTEPSRT